MILPTIKHGPTISIAIPIGKVGPASRYPIASFPGIKYTRAQSKSNVLPPSMVKGLVIVPSFLASTYPVVRRPLPKKRPGTRFSHRAFFPSAGINNKCPRGSDHKTSGHNTREYLKGCTLVNGYTGSGSGSHMRSESLSHIMCSLVYTSHCKGAQTKSLVCFRHKPLSHGRYPVETPSAAHRLAATGWSVVNPQVASSTRRIRRPASLTYPW